jgi:hypothetical protein
MRMAVVQVRVVRVLMQQRGVSVAMRVRLLRPIVGCMCMLMVLVMDVPMLVLQFGVFVIVLVPFSEV